MTILLAIAFLCTLAMPAAYAQQAYGNTGFVPINQVQVPGLNNSMPYQQVQNNAMYGQYGNQIPPQMPPLQNNMNYSNGQNYQSSQPQQASYRSSKSSSLSPYEQQELAIKESKMLQELEAMKASKEQKQGFRHSNDNSFSQNDGIVENGYVNKASKGKGKFRRAMGKLGSFVKQGAVAAAPAGAAVGTMFIMRAAFGPPATFMPVATPGGTAFIPVQGR